MKRYLWGVFTGVWLVIALLVAGPLLLWLLYSRAPDVRPNTTLILDLHGELPEQPASDIPGQLLGEREPETFLAVIRSIEQASSDKRISTILLKPASLEFGWSKLIELRGALERFK